MTGTMPARPSHKYVLLIIAALFLLLGVGLFFYENQDEVTLAIPVKLEHIPHDLIALRNTPIVLEARLKGPSRILKALANSQVYYGIDLSEAKPGPLFINLSPEMVKAPPRVSALEIDPGSLSLTIDTRIEKSVPVVPDLNKDPAPGYIISRVVASPSTVRLTGPMRVLEKISAVRTTPEHLVEVEIAVEQKIVEKWLDIAVQATGGNYYRYVITPDRVEVLLRGPMNTLKNLARDNGIQACVNLDGLGPGTYMRRAAIKPPLNTALLEARPEVFTVKVLESG